MRENLLVCNLYIDWKDLPSLTFQVRDFADSLWRAPIRIVFTCQVPVSVLLRRKLVNSGSCSNGFCSADSFDGTGQQFLIKRISCSMFYCQWFWQNTAAYRALTYVNGQPTGSLVLLPSVCGDRDVIPLLKVTVCPVAPAVMPLKMLIFSSITICTIPKRCNKLHLAPPGTHHRLIWYHLHRLAERWTVKLPGNSRAVQMADTEGVG